MYTLQVTHYSSFSRVQVFFSYYNVKYRIYKIAMSYDHSFYTELINPIVANELNEYIMITKLSLNPNDRVSTTSDIRERKIFIGSI